MTQEDAILAALKGLKRSKLKANLILCCMRGEGNDKENDETVELAKKYLVEDGGIVALDIAGAEALYPISKYHDLFLKAKNYSIPFLFMLEKQMGLRVSKQLSNLGQKELDMELGLTKTQKLKSL